MKINLTEPKYKIGETVFLRVGSDIFATVIKYIEFSKCTDGYLIVYHTDVDNFCEDSHNLLTGVSIKYTANKQPPLT